MAKLPIVKDKDLRATAQALKQQFIESAGPLVKQYVDAALGNGQLESTNADARNEVWDVLKQLMLQSSDKLELNIESAEDVLKAVTDGKCTMEEGKQLLDLYKKAKEINTIGMLPGAAATDGGLTINILNAGSKSQGPEPIEAEVVDGKQ